MTERRKFIVVTEAFDWQFTDAEINAGHKLDPDRRVCIPVDQIAAFVEDTDGVWLYVLPPTGHFTPEMDGRPKRLDWPECESMLLRDSFDDLTAALWVAP